MSLYLCVFVHAFGLDPTSSEEILSLNRLIRATHSMGSDDIDLCITCLNIDCIAYLLADIINYSFWGWRLPTSLENCKSYTNLQKTRRNKWIDKLQTYFNPSLFIKYFEKIMYNRLHNFVTKTNLLFPSQHGFQFGHSRLYLWCPCRTEYRMQWIIIIT